MSFFFDVWSYEGFTLASDVRYSIDNQAKYAHKIAVPTLGKSKVNCAVAFCGDYPKNILDYFTVAYMGQDTLRDVAERFASDWTERYAGIDDISAVHLVGYERVPETDFYIPQLWYWHNWTEQKGLLSKKRLNKDLASFSDLTPKNNHVPWKIKELYGKSLPSTLQEEYDLVMSFLRLNQPVFTWNGDNEFWFSAAQTIGSAMNLLSRKKVDWTILEIADLTQLCLKFLAKVGNMLPDSTVGLSASEDLDILSVTSEGSEWQIRADIKDSLLET